MSSSVYGGDERFGRGAPVDTRWSVKMGAGSRLGDEFKQAWEAMQRRPVSVLSMWERN